MKIPRKSTTRVNAVNAKSYARTILTPNVLKAPYLTHIKDVWMDTVQSKIDMSVCHCISCSSCFSSIGNWAEQLWRRPFSASQILGLIPRNWDLMYSWQWGSVVLQIIGYCSFVSDCGGEMYGSSVAISQTQHVPQLTDLLEPLHVSVGKVGSENWGKFPLGFSCCQSPLEQGTQSEILVWMTLHNNISL